MYITCLYEKISYKNLDFYIFPIVKDQLKVHGLPLVSSPYIEFIRFENRTQPTFFEMQQRI